MRLREKLWLWGQDAGTHHAYHGNEWKLPGVNRMGPAESARDLGLVNCCRVVMSNRPLPPFDAESEKLKDLHRVVWSIVGDGSSVRNNAGATDLEEVIRQARLFPNVCGGIFDDFFVDNAQPRVSLDQLKETKRRLADNEVRPLDLWVVYYQRQLAQDYRAYLDVCDVITLWTWRGSDLPKIDENVAKLCRITPGKRRLAGCYLWNYGESRPMTAGQMEYQCARYLDGIRSGDLDGIVFCASTLTDIGLESVEWLRGWIREVGDLDV
ncbi:MAG: hypothetical protein GXY85_08135 [Candidatus Brocadiaceae bacterium]|nr:hypothetical protein [Candidatus Brocadiaceae bacterium]